RLALANFYLASGKLAECEEVLKAALAQDVKSLEANRALGLFYVATNRVPEAERYFAALAFNAKDENASLTLADYYTVAKRSDDARKVLNDLVSSESAYAKASVRLAALDAAEGRRAPAEQRLREVLEKRPKEAAAQLLEARLLYLDGK